MTYEASMMPEPPLEFRYGQCLADPHDGLSMFGPYDADAPGRPGNISYGLVGRHVGVKLFQAFASALSLPIRNAGTDYDPRLWPTYPGFEAAFGSTLPSEATRRLELDGDRLTMAARYKDPFKRVGTVVEQYLDGLTRILKREEVVSFIIFVVPDIVYQNCRIKSRVSEAIGPGVKPKQAALRALGQTDLFHQYDTAHYRYSIDFRRQIKARAMKHGIPIQVIRESTLHLGDLPEGVTRSLTPLSDRAWNLSVAFYYKAGGKPWRLASARDRVCYVGIAYRLADQRAGSRSACCAAQMFLDDGDGVVFMGERGPWYSPENHQFHLSRDAAKRLLAGVLKAYEELEGKKPLREVFLHCRSGINRDEFSGFRAACPEDVKVVGIRVCQERPGGFRLYREGKLPVLRGTLWVINDRSCYLWGTGFKPRLNTYDGWEVPSPLQIDVQHGDSEITQVAEDIFGLTKLNYNACRLGESQPVTIGFSDAVGEILVSNPSVEAASPKFKFYI